MEPRFETIFIKYYNDIYRFIFSYTLNEFETKDILQDTFLKFYKNMANLPDDEIQIKKWLIRVASNGTKDFFKSFWYSRTKSISNEDSSITFNSDNKLLLDQLKCLTKRNRLILYLYYYEGYKIGEIAQILNCSESAIKINLSRIKTKIKIEMERQK